ncbi:MAG: T9SS type A sorting domain-containing protein [Chitinophagales bacterium]|nr:T9SS type A sorting domain-containing protein [Chitinophagales bacterium]
MRSLLLYPVLLLAISASAQPVLVRDIMPDVFSSTPVRLTVFNNKLYFFASDGVVGKELWGYNGKVAKLEQDIYSGSKDCTPATDNHTCVVTGGKMYFPADNGNTGLELFSYDGANPPALVSDIHGGAAGSDIDELVTLNGKIYFNADNGTNGPELWEHDPTLGQTVQLSFINVVAPGSSPQHLKTAMGKIYFSALSPTTGRELYEYDPSNNKVKLVADIYPSAGSSEPESLAELNGKLYFSAYTPGSGREIYVYDGTTVQQLLDMNPGAGYGCWASIDDLPAIGAIGNDLYFAGGDGTNGIQLFKYNTLSKTASFVATIDPNGKSYPAGFIYYANKVFFTADNGTHGRELWVLDGNGSATMVADINTNAQVGIAPNNLVVYDNGLYFTAYGDKGTELYKYIDPQAGVTDYSTLQSTVAYPNPAKDMLNIRLELEREEELVVRLTDATGRVVLTSKARAYSGSANTMSVPVTDLAAGVYHYMVRNTSGIPVASGRVVKM